MSRSRYAFLLLAAVFAVTGCAAPTDDEPSDPIEAEDEADTGEGEADEAVAEAAEELQACWGDESCNNMFSGPGCGGGAVCIDDMCLCW